MPAGLQVKMQLNREMRPWSLGAALQMIKETQENKHTNTNMKPQTFRQ